MRRASAARVSSRPPVARHAHEILESLARVLVMSGEAPRALAAEFAKICRRVSVPKLAEEPPTSSTLDHGHAISHWYSDPDFLDEKGSPRALPFSGDRSITELVRRLEPRADPAAVLATLRKLRAVRREGHRYRPVGRYVSLSHSRKEMISFLVSALRGIVHTIEHNATSERKDRLLDRAAINPRFPVRDLPAFYVRLGKHSSDLLRKADSAMHSKERRGTREPTIRLGVMVVAFEDPLVTGRTASLASRRRGTSRPARRGRRR